MVRANIEPASNGYVIYLYHGDLSTDRDKRFVAKTDKEVVEIISKYFKAEGEKK